MSYFLKKAKNIIILFLSFTILIFNFSNIEARKKKQKKQTISIKKGKSKSKKAKGGKGKKRKKKSKKKKTISRRRKKGKSGPRRLQPKKQVQPLEQPKEAPVQVTPPIITKKELIQEKKEPKIVPVPTERSFNNTGFDRSSPFLYERAGEGQQLLFSFLNKPFLTVSNLELFAGIPTIGHYRGEGYNLRKRMALIEFDPQDFRNKKIIPKIVLDAIAKSMITVEPEKMKYEQTLYFMIHGRVEDLKSDSLDHNLVYHPWVASWSGVRHSAPNIDMGIFVPNGVDKAQSGDAVPFDVLEARNVNTHPTAALGGGYEKLDAMSPDNARFNFGDRTISTFWSAAISPDKNHVVIVFHILANDEKAETMIQKAVDGVAKKERNTQEDIQALFFELEKIKLEKLEDQNALGNALKILSPVLSTKIL